MNESRPIKHLVLRLFSMSILLFEPAIARGAEVIKLSDFYKLPAGAYGMEFSDSLRAANGRVRTITGYMVAMPVE